MIFVRPYQPRKPKTIAGSSYRPMPTSLAGCSELCDGGGIQRVEFLAIWPHGLMVWRSKPIPAPVAVDSSLSVTLELRREGRYQTLMYARSYLCTSARTQRRTSTGVILHCSEAFCAALFVIAWLPGAASMSRIR